MVEADPVVQRQIAIWAARQAFTVAGIADLDWMTPAWTALDRVCRYPPSSPIRQRCGHGSSARHLSRTPSARCARRVGAGLIRSAQFSTPR
ncbi:hypothetical protein NKG94_22270 [Micromonospora sp. M12]